MLLFSVIHCNYLYSCSLWPHVTQPLHKHPIAHANSCINFTIIYQVYECTEVETKKKMAVKVFDVCKLTSQNNELDSFKREVEKLQKLRHERIVSLYDSVAKTEKLYIFMELLKVSIIYRHV